MWWTQSLGTELSNHGCTLVCVRTVTSLKANAEHSCSSLESANCELLASWLPIQGPVLCWSCCDVNVRLKEGHYTCRKTSAAMPVSEAVMCQASWKSVVHLPKTFLHLERLWRAYPTGQSCDIPWIFLLAFQNENKVFIKVFSVE